MVFSSIEETDSADLLRVSLMSSSLDDGRGGSADDEAAVDDVLQHVDVAVHVVACRAGCRVVGHGGFHGGAEEVGARGQDGERLELLRLLGGEAVQRCFGVLACAGVQGRGERVDEVGPVAQDLVEQDSGHLSGGGRGHGVACRDEGFGQGGEHLALFGIEHEGPQNAVGMLERVSARCRMDRSATAMIVAVGFMPVEVTMVLPSTTNRFGTSCVRHHSSTTELAGSVPILVVPSRCQALCRTTGIGCTSMARATLKSSIRRQFSPMA